MFPFPSTALTELHRTPACTLLPQDCVFWCEYLGAPERSITLNFSKPATNIIAQYYQFLRLGFSGCGGGGEGEGLGEGQWEEGGGGWGWGAARPDTHARLSPPAAASASPTQP